MSGSSAFSFDARTFRLRGRWGEAPTFVRPLVLVVLGVGHHLEDEDLLARIRTRPSWEGSRASVGCGSRSGPFSGSWPAASRANAFSKRTRTWNRKTLTRRSRTPPGDSKSGKSRSSAHERQTRHRHEPVAGMGRRTRPAWVVRGPLV